MGPLDSNSFRNVLCNGITYHAKELQSAKVLIDGNLVRSLLYHGFVGSTSSSIAILPERLKGSNVGLLIFGLIVMMLKELNLLFSFLLLFKSYA